MCTYRDNAMDRTGELQPDFRTAVEIEWSKGRTMDEGFSKPLENFSAAEVAPQSGAVRALPSDLTEREEIDLLCQVETYMNVTDKHSQTHPAAGAEEARIYSLVNSLIAKRFSDIGAAVRGEAVAGTAEQLLARIHDAIGHAESNDHRLEARFGQMKGVPAVRIDDLRAHIEGWQSDGNAAPVSARAADAPSEPSDKQIIEAMQPELDKGDGGYLCDMFPAGVIAAGRAVLRLRAADALDSQPTESTKDAK
jgi:hypothetical protein